MCECLSVVVVAFATQDFSRRPTMTTWRQQRRNGRSSAAGRRLATSRRVAVHHAASLGLGRRLLLLLLSWRQALLTAPLASRLQASTDAHARYLYPSGMSPPPQ